MTIRMPVLFMGHGNPMNAIEDNNFSRSWVEIGNILPKPKAILCISAHWETIGTQVTAMEKPRTIYDFYGFPPELYAVTYPAPGSLELARDIKSLAGGEHIAVDLNWGLDHGAWSVLVRLFPAADIPVVQLSLDVTKRAHEHYDMGVKLRPLREEGILIIGSGNIVHNLRMVVFKDIAYDWATSFDDKIKNWILEENNEPIIQYDKQGGEASLAINSAEHFKPLLYVVGTREPGEPVCFYTEKVWGGSVSMRSMKVGQF